MSNSGLGPAIIKSCDFEIDDKVKNFKDSDELLSFIENSVGPIGIKHAVMSFLPEHVIAVGESSTILNIVFFAEGGKGWEHIEKLMDRLTLRVKYSSMYGEEFQYHSITTHS